MPSGHTKSVSKSLLNELAFFVCFVCLTSVAHSDSRSLFKALPKELFFQSTDSLNHLMQMQTQVEFFLSLPDRGTDGLFMGSV